MVPLQPSVNRMACLLNVYRTALTGDAVYSWRLQSQFVLDRPKETRYAKLKPSSVNFLYIIYSNLVLYMFQPLYHHQKDNLVNMKGNALQWRAIFAGS
jgi:hypothetical protein